MGVWGSGLYANDTTSDVRDTYVKYLQDGLQDQEAYEKVLQEFESVRNDSDECPLFWFALADTQWKYGRLLPEVKHQALQWIAKGGGLSLWEDSASHGAGWKKTLKKLKEKLESPAPKRKSVRKPTMINQNLWNLNDLYAYQFPTEGDVQAECAGKFIVMQKIGEDEHYIRCGPLMRIQFYDQIFDTLPTLESLSGVRLLPLDRIERLTSPDGRPFGSELCMSNLILLVKRKEFPADCLTFIGNCSGPANDPNGPSGAFYYQLILWRDLPSVLSKQYADWHNAAYEDLENGTYRYIDP